MKHFVSFLSVLEQVLQVLTCLPVYLHLHLIVISLLLTDLIKRLEEENKVNVYLCQEKLPKVISSYRYALDKQYNCFVVFCWHLSAMSW